MNHAATASQSRLQAIVEVLGRFAFRLFIRQGALPYLLVLAVITFTVVADNFLTADNIFNILRQSSFLVIVALGQMLTLLTGGFDLSVGAVIAVASVTAALAMQWAGASLAESALVVILVGSLMALMAGVLIGAFNGIGVSVFGVSPFIMTMGTASIGTGIALYMSGGSPVYGLPMEFSDTLGFGRLAGISYPVLIMACAAIVMLMVVHSTRFGRYLFATGGNIKAAQLSGIGTKRSLFFAYTLCGLTAAIAGILLTARLDSGDPNIGQAFPLESIAACVIAGVSLRGGIGRVENVVMGAILIGIFKNGMNLSGVDSYMQLVVIGILLIIAVIADQFRLKYIARAA